MYIINRKILILMLLVAVDAYDNTQKVVRDSQFI